MPEIEVRLARDDEFEKINDLYNRANNNSRPFSHFQWEFLNGPGGKTIYIIAVDKTTQAIIGTQCVIPLYMSLTDGSKLLTAKSEDTYVDPSYRGLKLFDRLYEVLFQECEAAGIKAIWGFTYALKPFKKVGFETPFLQQQGVYVVDLFKGYSYLSGLNQENKLKQKAMIASLCVLSKITTLFKTQSFGKYQVVDKMVLDKVSVFPKSEWQNGCNTLWQDSAYTKWRLVDNPYPNDYHDLTIARPDGTIVSNVLVNVSPNKTGYIEQVIMKDGATKDDWKATIQVAISVLKKAGVSLIRFWGFDYGDIVQREISTLQDCGFIFVKKGTGFVWYDYNKNNSHKIEVSKILLSRIFTQGNG